MLVEKDKIFFPTELTLENLINSKKIFRIPDFQRSYTWDKEKTIDFIESISKSTQNRKLFLGSIYYNDRNGVYNITDGQQRIITLYLTINALRMLGNEDVTKYLYVSSHKSYVDIYEAEPLHNLLFKSDDLDSMKKLNQDDPNITLTKLQIIENQEYIFKYLSRNKNISEKFLDNLANVHVILVNVPKEENVYKIFRDINSKGVPLTNIDIIKNLFFESIKFIIGISTEKQEKYLNWKAIENNLLLDKRELDSNTLDRARKLLESNMTTILNWFLNFKTDSIIPFSKFYLSNKYEKYLYKPSIDALEVLKEIRVFSESSSFVLFPTQKFPSKKLLKKIHPYLIMLYNLGMKQHISIFIALYYKIDKLNKFQRLDKKLIHFCNKFYMYHFIFTGLLSDRGSKIGKSYGYQAIDLYKDGVLNFKKVFDFQNNNFYTAQRIISGLDERLFYVKETKGRKAIIEKLKQKPGIYSGVEQIRDFLTFLEYKLSVNEILISGIDIETVEHIFDSSLEYPNLDNFKLMSFLPLEESLNEKCNGLSFNEKIPEYKKSKYLLTKKFVEIYEQASDKSHNGIRELWKHWLVDKIISYFKM